MKKLVLLFTGLLFGLTTVTGNSTSLDLKTSGKLLLTQRYHHAQPILFVERGIEFIIFPNGDFDFNTSWETYGYNDYNPHDMYYRNTNSRRGNVGVSSPGRTSRYYNYGPRGVQVIHDRFGNVRRVGHVFINYDYYGRVKRIGSVYVKYRRNRLVQVGGLRLLYNRHGRFVGTRGKVNRLWNTNWNYSHFDVNNDFWHHNDDHYYYKKNGKKIKKSKQLKFRNFDRDDDDFEYDDD